VNHVIPATAIEEVAAILYDIGEHQNTHTFEAVHSVLCDSARIILEAAAPHMPSNDEAKLAAIIILLDRFKWMETSDETGGYADEALSKIRVILDTP
jgi:hypothetical protein